VAQSKALKSLANSNGPVLFNLSDHPDELSDCSAEKPDIVKQLSELAIRKLAETKEVMIPLWQPGP
jgi:hypothetical protein